MDLEPPVQISLLQKRRKRVVVELEHLWDLIMVEIKQKCLNSKKLMSEGQQHDNNQCLWVAAIMVPE